MHWKERGRGIKVEKENAIWVAKGKGYKGNCWNHKGGYRSPGEAIRKSLNYYSNGDFQDAWGEDQYRDDSSHDNGDLGCDMSNNGFMGNLTMMLERCDGRDKNEIKTTEQITNREDWTLVENLGRRDALTGKTSAKPVRFQNSVKVLGDDDDETTAMTTTMTQTMQLRPTTATTTTTMQLRMSGRW